jgi:CRISPR/Cas system-associated exonuclease Cas4 (RecB family)
VTVAQTKPRSHSQLADYLHCSHAFYLKRLRKVSEQPSVWLPGGKAFHSATEAHDRASWEIRENGGDLSDIHDPEPFVELFDQHFEEGLAELREQEPDESKWRTAGRATKEKPNGEDVAWWRDAGRVFTANYVNWRTTVENRLVIATVAEGPGVEIQVARPIGGVNFVGYIDLVLIDLDTGTWFVCDKKTGSRAPVSPMQLAVYSEQLERETGRQVSWGCYYDARKAYLTEPIDLSGFTQRKLARVYENLDRGIQEGIFLPRIDSHCKSCGVRRACVYQNGVEPSE